MLLLLSSSSPSSSPPSPPSSSHSQVVEDGYEFFAKRQLVTLFSAPNYCGEFDNAGGMMSVDESLMCSFQVAFFLKVKGHTLDVGSEFAQ